MQSQNNKKPARAGNRCTPYSRETVRTNLGSRNEPTAGTETARGGSSANTREADNDSARSTTASEGTPSVHRAGLSNDRNSTSTTQARGRNRRNNAARSARGTNTNASGNRTADRPENNNVLVRSSGDGGRQPQKDIVVQTHCVCGDRLPKEPWQLRCNHKVCDPCGDKQRISCDLCRFIPENLRPPVELLPFEIRKHCRAANNVTWAMYDVLSKIASDYENLKKERAEGTQKLARAEYALHDLKRETRRKEENASKASKKWRKVYHSLYQDLQEYLKRQDIVDAHKVALHKKYKNLFREDSRCHEETTQASAPLEGPQVASGSDQAAA